MGFWEKLGGAFSAFLNDNFEEGWKQYGSAIDELFDSDSKRPRKKRMRPWEM